LPAYQVRTITGESNIAVITMCADLKDSKRLQLAWIMKKGEANSYEELTDSENNLLDKSQDDNLWKDLEMLGFAR
jgi:hypothetical protein